jgi:hypothetical protein
MRYLLVLAAFLAACGDKDTAAESDKDTAVDTAGE